MADSKPGTLAKLQTGKLIDTCKHFVATMNWVISCLANIRGQKKSEVEENAPRIEISGLDSGKPVLKIKGEGGRKYKCGEDSNIVISEKPDKDGFYTIDVYYV